MDIIENIEAMLLDHITLSAPIDSVRVTLPYDFYYWADDADIEAASPPIIGERASIEISGRGKSKLILSLLIGGNACAPEVSNVTPGEPVRAEIVLSAPLGRAAIYQILKWAAPHEVHVTTSGHSSSA